MRRKPTFKAMPPERVETIIGEPVKAVPGFPGYYCTTSGRIISTLKGSCKEIPGSPDKDGYLKVALVKEHRHTHLRKHRVITLTFLGASDLEVNHINGNKQDNRLQNLEYVSARENQCHRRKAAGYKVGVCFDKKTSKWRAYLQHNKKWEHLGFFRTEAQAKTAYLSRLAELNITNRYGI